MKKIFTFLLFIVSFLLMQLSSQAQDSARISAIKQINKTSEQSDKQVGKKIQQQSLSTTSFKPLDTAVVNTTHKVVKKKSTEKCRHMH